MVEGYINVSDTQLRVWLMKESHSHINWSVKTPIRDEEWNRRVKSSSKISIEDYFDAPAPSIVITIDTKRSEPIQTVFQYEKVGHGFKLFQTGDEFNHFLNSQF